MKYHISEINLSKGAANRDLVRDDVTLETHSLTIANDTFRIGVLHVSPQGRKTLEDVVEFEIPFADAPQELVDRFTALRDEIEKHFIATIYQGATPV